MRWRGKQQQLLTWSCVNTWAVDAGKCVCILFFAEMELRLEILPGKARHLNAHSWKFKFYVFQLNMPFVCLFRSTGINFGHTIFTIKVSEVVSQGTKYHFHFVNAAAHCHSTPGKSVWGCRVSFAKHANINTQQKWSSQFFLFTKQCLNLSSSHLVRNAVSVDVSHTFFYATCGRPTWSPEQRRQTIRSARRCASRTPTDSCVSLYWCIL